MSHRLFVDRRAMLMGLALLPLLAGVSAHAGTAPLVSVSKDPNCGCCGDWIEHMRANGFALRIADSDRMGQIKQRLGVPEALASCHTAEVEGYVIEGHVPASAVHRLLATRPAATGLAVPGMPMGSPGMDYPGVEPETYDVVLFGPAGQQRFARFHGGREI